MRKGTGEKKATNNLKLDDLAVKLEGADLKVDADGGDVRVAPRVVCETQQQTALADTTVADQKQLEQIVVVALHNKVAVVRGRGSRKRSLCLCGATTTGVEKCRRNK